MIIHPNHHLIGSLGVVETWSFFFEVCETFRYSLNKKAWGVPPHRIGVVIQPCVENSYSMVIRFGSLLPGWLPLDKFQESLHFFATQCTWIRQHVAKCYERWDSRSEKKEMDWQFVVGNASLHDKWDWIGSKSSPVTWWLCNQTWLYIPKESPE